jgi:hypothetical protein
MKRFLEPHARGSIADQPPPSPIPSDERGAVAAVPFDEEDLHILFAVLALESRCPFSKANDGEAANAAATQDAVGNRT